MLSVQNVEPKICQLAKFISEFQWCYYMMTLTDKESKLEINLLACLQATYLMEDWSNLSYHNKESIN